MIQYFLKLIQIKEEISIFKFKVKIMKNLLTILFVLCNGMEKRNSYETRVRIDRE